MYQASAIIMAMKKTTSLTLRQAFSEEEGGALDKTSDQCWWIDRGRKGDSVKGWLESVEEHE
jgi:hypothetical protein